LLGCWGSIEEVLAYTYLFQTTWISKRVGTGDDDPRSCISERSLEHWNDMRRACRPVRKGDRMVPCGDKDMLRRNTMARGVGRVRKPP
jgi:hypothetical protein